MKLKDLTGKRYGRFTVIKISERDSSGRTKWICRCDCGCEKIVCGEHLVNGHTKSCGCLRRELLTIHGKNKSPEYRTWQAMKTRCESKNSTQYLDYGGRGIKVCERWRNSFNDFYEDMGDKPSKEYSIERKNNDGNYEPSNCVWATRSEQRRNQRISSRNKTGIVGVKINRGNRYVATIKGSYIGSFKLLEDAAKAREKAEVKYWGE